MRATSPAAPGLMDMMAWAAAALLALAPQEPLEARVAALLRALPPEPEPEELDALLASLEALGAAALLPISRALAEDLRDGLAAAAAPALVDALVGHRDALEPLRAALRDPRTSPAGRLEIARALDDLGDDSWRGEILALSRDPAEDPLLRRRAASLLEPVLDEPRATLGAEPAPRVSVPRKKTERPPAEPGTMLAALFIGGAIAVLGMLLWALRGKD